MSLALLRSSPAFRSLAASRGVSELGTWFAYVGLTVSVYDRTHSAEWISVLLLLGLAPSVVFGFTLAPLLDRVVRKHALVAAELVGGAAFVALCAVRSLPALLVFAGIAGMGVAIVRPGLSAALPNLVTPGELPRANGSMRAITSAAMLSGPPLAGVIVSAAGVVPVFALNAASFAASAVLLARLPRERLQGERRPGGRARLGAGFALFRTPELRGLLASWTLAQVSWVIVNVGEVLLARSVFHTGNVGFGLLAGCSGAGLLVGSLGAAAIGDRLPSAVAYRASLLLAAAGVAGAAATHSFPVALLAVAAGAVGNACAISYAHLIVQRSVEDCRRGQAFGAFAASVSTAAVAGMIAAGRLESALGVRAAWEIGAGIAAAAAAISWALSRRTRTHPRAAAAQPLRDG